MGAMSGVTRNGQGRGGAGRGNRCEGVHELRTLAEVVRAERDSRERPGRPAGSEMGPQGHSQESTEGDREPQKSPK